MSTTETTTPADNTTDSTASIEKLSKALEAERAAHKQTKREMLDPLRNTLGLGDDADLEAVTSTLSARLGNADARIAEQTETLTAERDEARAEAEKVRAERNVERVEAAIIAALGKSAMIEANHEDAMALLTPLFGVGDDGRVVSLGGESGEPGGLTPDQFVAARLGALRPHWFAQSVGGGTRSPGSTPLPPPGADVFRRGTLTAQAAWVARHGEAAARDACRKLGLTDVQWFGGRP